MHPFLKILASTNPTFFSVRLDEDEVYKGKFTADGIVTIRDELLDTNVPRRRLTVFLDDAPIPADSIALDREVKEEE